MKLFLLLTFFLAAAPVSFAQRYTAEGCFVVDDEAVTNYMNLMPSSRTVAVNRLRSDLKCMLNEVNEMLSTLRPFVDIQLKICDVRVLNTDIFPNSDFEPRSNLLDPTSAVKRIATWRSNNAQTCCDFTIFYTGYQMHEATGSAYIGDVCDDSTSVGVVEAKWTFVQAIDTAIQLAHVLGAPNDGPTSEYLEAPLTTPTDRYRWSFSSTSGTWIRNQIRSLPSNNCLTRTSSGSSAPSTSLSNCMRLLDPDTICERTLNDTRSYVCLSNNLYDDAPPSGDDICRQIYCHIPGTSLCRPTFSTDRSVCGSRQRCDDGQCRRDLSAPSNVDSNCLWGDQEQLDFPLVPFSGTCGQFIAQYGLDECYTPVVSQLCCQTCKRCTGPPGCECGDRSSQCVTYTRSQVCPAYGDEICCGYCQGYVGKRSIYEISSVNITIERIEGFQMWEFADNSTHPRQLQIAY